MRLTIDSDKCTGHGLCYSVARQLIRYDDRGYGVVIEQASLEQASLEQARRAVAACPEQAVSIVDDRSADTSGSSR